MIKNLIIMNDKQISKYFMNLNPIFNANFLIISKNNLNFMIIIQNFINFIKLVN